MLFFYILLLCKLYLIFLYQSIGLCINLLLSKIMIISKSFRIHSYKERKKINF